MKRQGPLILLRSQDSLAAMGRPGTGLKKRPTKGPRNQLSVICDQMLYIAAQLQVSVGR